MRKVFNVKKEVSKMSRQKVTGLLQTEAKVKNKYKKGLSGVRNINNADIILDSLYDELKKKDTETKQNTVYHKIHTHGKQGRPSTGSNKKAQERAAGKERKLERHGIHTMRYIAEHPEREVPVTIDGKTQLIRTTHRNLSNMTINNGNITKVGFNYKGNKQYDISPNKYYESVDYDLNKQSGNLRQLTQSVVSGTSTEGTSLLSRSGRLQGFGSIANFAATPGGGTDVKKIKGGKK